MNVKSRKAEQAEATQAAVIGAARALFAARGYADVPTGEIVQRAGVTRGALYHHFRDKRDLFRAVVEQLEQETVEKIASAAFSESDPWLAPQTALGALLDVCLGPDGHRVVPPRRPA